MSEHSRSMSEGQTQGTGNPALRFHLVVPATIREAWVQASSF